MREEFVKELFDARGNIERKLDALSEADQAEAY